MQKFDERGNVRNRVSFRKPIILNKCGNHEVLRRVNNPPTSTAVVVGKELWS